MLHSPPRLRLAAALLLVAAPALAHDTWFHRDAADERGRWTLALGTGNRFPVQETPIAAEFLTELACRQGDEAPRAMTPLPLRDTALPLRTPPAAGGLSCWVQSQPFELELAPEKIAVYLKEIGAAPSLRATWEAMRARGLPWKERYTKHARIELPGAGAKRAVPTGMAMDVLPLGDASVWRAGDTFDFQVLRDGLPLADLAVELRNERAAIGLWRRTDARGMVSLRLPLPGRWVLRGTDLRMSAIVPDTWESRFVTLAFDVATP